MKIEQGALPMFQLRLIWKRKMELGQFGDGKIQRQDVVVFIEIKLVEFM